MSPAKMIDFKSKVTYDVFSKPLYLNEAHELNDILKQLSSDEIARLMQINPKQSMDVNHYIQSFDMADTPQRQGIFAYNGIAFKGFDAPSLPIEDWEFAQKHLIILSGMYGIVRPLDLIKPYRLEMQIVLQNLKGKDLYAYWKQTINSYFGQELKNDDNVWVNLCSTEYSKIIDRKLLPKGYRIITPIFKEYDKAKDQYSMKVVYAKKARGMMARFIIENKLTDPEYIKAFDKEGYYFSPQLSNDKEWVFVR